MSSYIFADLKRVAVRIPRLIAIAAVTAIVIIVLIVSHGDTWTSVTFVTIMEQIAKSALPVLFGLIALFAVYSDDFKAKTMQVAIGVGITRHQVILCKYIETILLTLADIVIIGAAAFIAAAVWGTSVSGSQILEICISLLLAEVSIAAYMSLTMILLFFMQSTSIGILLYLALSTGMVSSLVNALLNSDSIADLHLSRFTLTFFINLLQSRIALGTVSVQAILGIAVYIIVGYTITVAVFKKRELEF